MYLLSVNCFSITTCDEVFLFFFFFFAIVVFVSFMILNWATADPKTFAVIIFNLCNLFVEYEFSTNFNFGIRTHIGFAIYCIFVFHFDKTNKKKKKTVLDLESIVIFVKIHIENRKNSIT